MSDAAVVESLDPDLALRQAAITRALELRAAYDDIVPRSALALGFEFRGGQISFGSFQKGIHRAKEMQGPAALTLLTAAHAPGKAPPYDDELDLETGVIRYHYRAGSINQADNRALRAAYENQSPLIYFRGLVPGQYLIVAPIFVLENRPGDRVVLLQVGIPLADTQPGGPVSTETARRYALVEVRRRLHQHRFRLDVLRAYRQRCAVCSLRQRELVQAAHIVPDVTPDGIAGVVNGLALCAIHHLAYDRNLLGIDPAGVVHLTPRLRDEHDGPMLREGLQGFHGAAILRPRRIEEHPDPDRLATRFADFQRAA